MIDTDLRDVGLALQASLGSEVAPTLPMTVLGEDVNQLAPSVYVVSFPDSISRSAQEQVINVWHEVMGDDAKLIVLQNGATLSTVAQPRIVDLLDRLIAWRHHPLRGRAKVAAWDDDLTVLLDEAEALLGR